MTFFLTSPQPDATDAPPPPPTDEIPFNPAPRPPAGFGETFSAAWRQETLLQNSWDYAGQVQRQLLEEINSGLTDKPFARPLVEEWQRTNDWRPIRAAILDAARRQAALEPGAWGALPLDDASFEREALRRRKAELEDAQQTLAMGSGPVAEFLGAAGRASTDPVSLALMPLGIEGSLARVFLGETALGVLGEAIALPAQFSTAEELDQPDPDVATQLALGGVGSGVLATAPAALVRGSRYLLGRRERLRVGQPENADPAAHQAREEAATLALREDRPIPAPEPVTDDRLDRTARRIIQVESGGRPGAKNPNSTATGPAQMTEGTWLGLIERHRPDLSGRHGRAELLALRTNPELALQMTVALARENRDFLQARGFDGSEPDLYLAHFLGADGAARALGAPPDAPITRVMSEDQLAANSPKRQADGSWTGGVKFDGRPIRSWTVQDLRRWAEFKMGLTNDPGGGYAAGSRAGYTRPDQVVTPEGQRVDVSYEVVDLDSLIFASGDRQNRDRARSAPTAEVIRRAANLDPALLMPDPKAGYGAPIVGPDDVIDSGNGRTMSIAYAARNVRDRYDAYVAAIRAAGFEIPEGVANPVLVARRGVLSPEDEARLARGANVDAVERLSATEQARTDAVAIDDELLGLYDPQAGDPLGARNARFLRGLVDRLPAGERGALLTGDARLSAPGRERLRSALFARAYDAPDLTTIQAEEGGGEVRAIAEALTDAAAPWAQMRAAIAAGRLDPSFDLTADLIDAIRLVQAARRTSAAEGLSVRAAIEDALAQGDMFGGGPSPAVARLVGLLYDGGRARSRESMARSLTDYAIEAARVGDPNDLLAATGRGGPLDVLDALGERVGREEPPARADAPDDETPPQRPAGAVPDGSPRLIDIEGVDDAAWRDGAASPLARAADDQAEAELRAAVGAEPADAAARADVAAEILAGGDFEVEIDGVPARASDVLRELDEDAEFADAIQFCMPGGRRHA